MEPWRVETVPPANRAFGRGRMRRLIINADDFGLSPAVNAGILEAHAAGRVTSTSMMVCGAGWDDGVRMARATPTLDVGLHLNLLVGAPLSRAPSLTDPRTGHYLTLPALVRRALTRRLRRDEVVAECEAQLAALRAVGIVVTHLDSHRHTHALPRIRGAIAAVAARHGLSLRRPLESMRWFPTDVATQMHRAVVAWSWRLSSPGAAATRAPDYFIGMALQGGDRFPGRLAAAVTALPNGTIELMVHPGRVDDALRLADGYTWQRERELDALLSPAFGKVLSRPDITLVTFRAV